MDALLEDWFARRTWQEPDWTAADLLAAKAGRTVSVVLPALDEEETVGAIVAAIVPFTAGPAPLVDELVVLDSGSTDRTVELAAAVQSGSCKVRRANQSSSSASMFRTPVRRARGPSARGDELR
jgi:glucosyl-3-phosphoglycerate synthase